MPAQEQRFGPYRALAVIGRGGMGIVYEAERADGQFERRVAVKVIRADGSPDLLRRLVAERQILASLDHPAIAKLLDGGVTDDGRPYLVMERVDGLPIDVHCDEHRLTVRARLELMLPVFEAVQHAHRNLIIHRDLKPSNIFVTVEGRPKLLDFGIAKLLDAATGLVAAGVTRTEQLLTPEYASPEQLRGAPLTTATDVYSLGLVLYRLLTGSPAHDGPAAARGDAEPPPPSARVPPHRRAALRGDVDAIVMKALRVEALERYGSVGALAQDVAAYLKGHTVVAHQGSNWYRLRKLVRRHRGRAFAGGVLAAGVLVGMGVALWQASIAGRERDRARTALGYAQESVEQSREVSRFLVGVFAPTGGRAEAPTLDALLGRSLVQARAMAGQPTVHATMLDVIGQIHARLARYAQAETLATAAYDMRRAVLGPDHPDVAESMIHVARAHLRQGRTAEGRRLGEEALRIRRAVLAPTDIRIAEALTAFGGHRDHAEHERFLREALAIYAASGADVRQQVGTMHRLSTVLKWRGRLAECVRVDRDALALAERRLGPEAAATGKAMIHLADQVHDIEHDFAEAETLYRSGLAILERREGANSLGLMHGLNSLAGALERQGKYLEAEQFIRRAHAIQLAATGLRHPEVAIRTAALAHNLARQGRRAAALRLARESLALLETAFGRAHFRYADGLGDLAHVHALLGEWDAAIVAQRAAMNHDGMSVHPAGPQGEGYRTLGLYLMSAGRLPEAETELLRSLELLRQHHGDEDHHQVQRTKRALQRLYTAWGRPLDAERFRVPPPQLLEPEW